MELVLKGNGINTPFGGLLTLKRESNDIKIDLPSVEQQHHISVP